MRDTWEFNEVIDYKKANGRDAKFCVLMNFNSLRNEGHVGVQLGN